MVKLDYNKAEKARRSMPIKGKLKKSDGQMNIDKF